VISHIRFDDFRREYYVIGTILHNDNYCGLQEVCLGDSYNRKIIIQIKTCMPGISGTLSERGHAQIFRICVSIGNKVTRTVLTGPAPVVPFTSATLIWFRDRTGSGGAGVGLLL